MKYLARALMACVAASAVAAPALGADYVEPVVVEAPEPAPAPVAMGGWYIRGDIGYAWNKFRGSTYHIDACGTTCATVEQTGTLNGELKGAFTLGGGIGYHINHYLRADLTLDHTFKSDFTGSTTGTCTRSTGPGPDGVLGTADDIIGTATCTSSDTASFSAMALMANAYVDFGNFGKIKPYVGAGIGGARVTWSDLSNTIPAGFHQSGTTVHPGSAEWRFAWALMAGVSVAATHNVDLDFGYRFRRIESGRMFGWANGAGPGFDHGIEQHEVRAGLRYKFGGGYASAGGCCVETAKY